VFITKTTNILLTTSFPGQPRQSSTRKVKSFCIFVRQQVLGWQLHMPDNIQIVCTSLGTDNHANTSSLNFYGLDALHDTQQQSTEDCVCYKLLTRSSAIAEGPRDASCQLKSCQLPCNSAETTCTTSPQQSEVMKLRLRWADV